MDAGTSRLADRCAQVARQMSLSQVESVVDFLLRSSDSGWDAVYHALLGHVPAPCLKQAVGDLLKAWRDHQPTSSPRELAITLLAAARAVDSERNSEIVDLIPLLHSARMSGAMPACIFGPLSTVLWVKMADLASCM